MPEPFTTMRDWDDKFARAVGLGHPTMVVGWYVKRFADYETGERVRPSTRRIAYETGIDVSRIRGVKGHLGRLVEAGWLVLIKSATPTAPAAYRLGIGAYRPSWSETPDRGASGSPGTSGVPGASGSPGTPDAIPGVRVAQPLGVRLAQPDLSLHLPKTFHSCASTDVEHVSDTDTEPVTLIDLPEPAPTSQAKNATKRAAATQATEADFDAWWADYPRKVSRAEALKAYVKARKSVTAETLTNALAKQLPGMLAKDKDFLPHGATWLNKKRWEDPVTDAGETDPYRNVERWVPPPLASDADAGQSRNGPSSPPPPGHRTLRAVSDSPARVDPSGTLLGDHSRRSASR